MTRNHGTPPDPRPTDADNTTRIDGRGEVTDTIETRVARGVALLDKTLADWDERIDLGKLDLRSGCGCVLGQEFAEAAAETETGFDIGLAELFANDVDKAAKHGFAITRRELDRSRAAFEALTVEWKRVILARRVGAR